MLPALPVANQVMPPVVCEEGMIGRGKSACYVHGSLHGKTTFIYYNGTTKVLLLKIY